VGPQDINHIQEVNQVNQVSQVNNHHKGSTHNIVIILYLIDQIIEGAPNYQFYDPNQKQQWRYLLTNLSILTNVVI
jgi:hypothetical protein